MSVKEKVVMYAHEVECAGGVINHKPGISKGFESEHVFNQQMRYIAYCNHSQK